MELNLRRIKAERIAKGYTQDVVAEKMGWKSRTPYVKRENGMEIPYAICKKRKWDSTIWS